VYVGAEQIPPAAMRGGSTPSADLGRSSDYSTGRSHPMLDAIEDWSGADSRVNSRWIRVSRS
jgi:hypothetical protein